MTHPLDEPQPGGLIDKYWIMNWIIFPIFMIGIIFGSMWIIGKVFSCPYVEDVSSCFPYNMPNWFAVVPIIGLVLLFTLLYYISYVLPKTGVEIP